VTETEHTSILKRLGPAGLLGILWTALPAIAGVTLLAYLGTVSDWLHSLGPSGVVVYACMFVVSAGLGLLPTYAQAVLGGWVFGFGLGFPAALAGFTGGAMIGYVVAKLVSQHRIEEVIRDHPRAETIRSALLERGFARTLGIIALLRLPPNSPFALTNLAMAGCAVPPVPFTLGTMIGMAPRTGIAVFFAAAAAATGAKDIQSFVQDGLGLWVLIAGIVVMLVVLAIIGNIASRALDRLGPTEPDEAGAE